ncbi:hypothetical protein [Photorhabdus bodei]|uniref:Uncharacterized protein n=1 Tax=Photorhabdus bodei TaxID=2029681 RepID=A0AAW6BNE9_9GAMM|nr:hypothetical protein [Photorhabdus bodei]MDB6374968.1 hypothetical protein [Photorhabdus bodei]
MTKRSAFFISFIPYMNNRYFHNRNGGILLLSITERYFVSDPFSEGTPAKSDAIYRV